MRAVIKPDDQRDENGNDILYFEVDDSKRYVACVVAYDTDTNEWVVTANDSEVARF